MAGDRVIPKSDFNPLANEVLIKLNDFRKTNKFCDVTILAEGLHYQAHKVILAGFSPYFESMFLGEFRDTSICKVNLDKSVQTAVLEMVLEYAYTNTIDITKHNVQSILHVANFFKSTPLRLSCCQFLKKNINAENCVGVYRLAELYLCAELKEKARDFLLTHFREVCQSVEFLELEPEYIIDIISHDALNVPKEEVVFEAVMHWLQFKQEVRAPILSKVFAHIRLAFIDPYFLHDRVESVEAIRRSPSCMRLVEEANRYNLLPNRRMELQSMLTKRRKTSPDIEAMLIYGKHVRTKKKKLYCINEDGRIVRQLRPPPSKFVGCFVSNYKLMIAADTYEIIWRYDVKSDNWKEISPMAEQRSSFGMCELDGYWYSVGGEDVVSNTPSGTVERYDPRSDVWIRVAPLPEAVNEPAVVSLRGMIYVIGGTARDYEATDHVQRYDPRSNTWKQLAPMHSPCIPSACTLNGNIYISIGKSVVEHASVNSDSSEKGVFRMDIYDVSTNKWGHGPALLGECIAGPVVVNGNIYALTEPAADSDRTLEIYSPETNSWRVYAIFPHLQPRIITDAVILSSNHSRIDSEDNQNVIRLV